MDFCGVWLNVKLLKERVVSERGTDTCWSLASFSLSWIWCIKKSVITPLSIFLGQILLSVALTLLLFFLFFPPFPKALSSSILFWAASILPLRDGFMIKYNYRTMDYVVFCVSLYIWTQQMVLLTLILSLIVLLTKLCNNMKYSISYLLPVFLGESTFAIL